MQDLKRRVLDLLSMFAWHDGIVEQLCCLGQPGRYAVVSQSIRDDADHWIDGFADDLTTAAAAVADLDDEWKFVGVFDLSGAPGDPVAMVPTHIRYEVGESGEGHVTRPMGFSERSINPVGTHDAGWAEGLFDEE
jgi:hypothetical protein